MLTPWSQLVPNMFNRHPRTLSNTGRKQGKQRSVAVRVEVEVAVLVVSVVVKQHLNKKNAAELRGCVKVAVAVLIVLVVSGDVKQQ